jgi:hypothetical protein
VEPPGTLLLWRRGRVPWQYILVCWTIWRERNAKVFEGIERHANSMMAEVKTEARLWTQARVYLD